MADSEKMAEIVRPFSTVSDRIRALHAAGHSRVQIAEFLHKRYQHVRNVLVADEQKRRGAARDAAEPLTGLGENPTPAWSVSDLSAQGAVDTAMFRLKISEDGAINLPPSVEEKLGYRRGGVVIADLSADRLVLWSTSGAVRRAQALVRELIPDRDSLADSLIADRRREANAERDT